MGHSQQPVSVEVVRDAVMAESVTGSGGGAWPKNAEPEVGQGGTRGGCHRQKETGWRLRGKAGLRTVGPSWTLPS